MTIRGGGNPHSAMAAMPLGEWTRRLGALPAEAYDCFMVETPCGFNRIQAWFARLLAANGRLPSDHRGRPPRINPVLARLLKTGGGHTVDIVLPGRLHGAEAYMNAVAKVVSDAIDQGKSLSMADIADVSLGEFDLQDEPFLATEPSQALERVVERLGRINR